MANETKRERFVRIAEARTNRVLDDLRLLGNCSSKKNYEYSDADVRKIFSAIEKELKVAKARYQGGDSSDERFTLE
jgi:hypothetical protein